MNLHVPHGKFEIDEYESLLNDNGIQYAVLAAPSFLGIYNEYAIDAIRNRQRFKTTAIVDPGIDPYILKAMDADRVVGIRLSLRGSELPDFASYQYRLFFKRLADLDWHVHVNIDGEGIPGLLAALGDAPVRLVFDHYGRPEPRSGAESEGFKALLAAYAQGKVWVKLSGGFRLGCDPAVLASRLIEAGGTSRLVWGSDCPFTNFAGTVDFGTVVSDFERYVPDMKHREEIEAAGKRLYKFN
jgi:predicted TIM-barrel fold metal-dependent hydrolase